MKDIAELTKQLGNKDSAVRRSAAELLGFIEDETAIDALIPALKDGNRFVRQEAVLALKRLGGSRAVEHLTQALNTEKNEFVRDFISRSLERLQSKESASLVLESYESRKKDKEPLEQAKLMVQQAIEKTQTN